MLLHPQKLGTWCAMNCKCVVGPIFVETTTAEVYHIIQQFIELLHKDESDAVFQKANAQPHVAKDMMCFEEFFERTDKWPPYSPDLRPLDFVLWSYLKNTVYKDGI